MSLSKPASGTVSLSTSTSTGPRAEKGLWQLLKVAVDYVIAQSLFPFPPLLPPCMHTSHGAWPHDLLWP